MLANRAEGVHNILVGNSRPPSAIVVLRPHYCVVQTQHAFKSAHAVDNRQTTGPRLAHCV